MAEPKVLIFVDADVNHNKFYRMIPQGDTLHVEYGRVGCENVRTQDYPISQFDKLLKSKLKKGYQDQTSLVKDLISESKSGKANGFLDIKNVSIREIVNRLQKFAKATIAENYTVSSSSVTQAMCDRAQEILNEIPDITDLELFNKKLVELFTAIPRKMLKVHDYLAESSKDYSKIISREQDLLDTMRGQVVTHTAEEDNAEDSSTADQKTILDSLGLKFSDCTDEDVKKIKNLLGYELSGKFKKAWRVINEKTQKRYDAFVKDNNITNQKMYWHGSRNENWWSILQSGLVLRPTNAVITGKMFGYGLYYANKARKSYGYTSARGSYWARGNSSSAFMAVMDVAEGLTFDVKHHTSEYYSYDWKKFSKLHPGKHSLFAHGGADLRNDEIIVYKEEQSTIHYLVELEG